MAARGNINQSGYINAVTDVSPGLWDVSPDGKTTAYSFSDKTQNRTRVAVQSLEAKNKIKYLDITRRGFLLFCSDSKSLLTKPIQDIASDWLSAIYSFPIAGGGLPQKIIRNSPENFYWADLSDEGKHLVWVQGKIVSNVVLLTHAY
jgi:hypothetical protein